MAAIVGSWMATIRNPHVLPGMVHGSLTQLVTGVAMVALFESGAVELEGGQKLDLAKIGVKLVIALVVTVLAWVNRKRGDKVSTAVFHAIGGLALSNIVIAVMWT